MTESLTLTAYTKLSDQWKTAISDARNQLISKLNNNSSIFKYGFEKWRLENAISVKEWYEILHWKVNSSNYDELIVSIVIKQWFDLNKCWSLPLDMEWVKVIYKNAIVCNEIVKLRNRKIANEMLNSFNIAMTKDELPLDWVKLWKVSVVDIPMIRKEYEHIGKAIPHKFDNESVILICINDFEDIEALDKLPRLYRWVKLFYIPEKMVHDKKLSVLSLNLHFIDNGIWL